MLQGFGFLGKCWHLFFSGLNDAPVERVFCSSLFLFPLAPLSGLFDEPATRGVQRCEPLVETQMLTVGTIREILLFISYDEVVSSRTRYRDTDPKLIVIIHLFMIFQDSGRIKGTYSETVPITLVLNDIENILLNLLVLLSWVVQKLLQMYQTWVFESATILQELLHPVLFNVFLLFQSLIDVLRELQFLHACKAFEVVSDHAIVLKLHKWILQILVQHLHEVLNLIHFLISPSRESTGNQRRHLELLGPSDDLLLVCLHEGPWFKCRSAINDLVFNFFDVRLSQQLGN